MYTSAASDSPKSRKNVDVDQNGKMSGLLGVSRLAWCARVMGRERAGEDRARCLETGVREVGRDCQGVGGKLSI